jgi:AraC-like DNA-binding protein
MDEQQLYCNSELKASDVAALLGTNSRYVTDSIRECRDMTFTQFINDYRIRYIQQLLRQNPDRKIIEVYAEAGFASERSFFRIFKETTGMTTSEWLSQNVGRQ